MHYRYSSPALEHLVVNSPPMPDYDGHPVGEWRKNCPLCPPNSASPNNPQELIERLRRRTPVPGRPYKSDATYPINDDGPEAADLLLAYSIEIEGLRRRVGDGIEATNRRSVPMMDAVWSAGWNCAMDYVKARLEGGVELIENVDEHIAALQKDAE